MSRLISCMLLAGLTALSISSCGENVTGDEKLGSISIGLSSFATESASLYLQNNKGFRLKIYKSPPQSKNEEPYYDTGCRPYGGALFSVYGIPVGSNRAIMFEGYTSITEVKPGEWRCDNQAYFGLRGGIEVSKENPDAFYFIPVFNVGGFTSFPVWRKDLVQKASTIYCTSDAECQKQVDSCTYDEEKGKEVCVKEYLIHPLAVCDMMETRCKFNVSQFPLNMKDNRAFHTSHSLPDGRVLIIGGLNKSDKDWFFAQNPAIEIFNASTSLFSEIKFSGLTIQHAFHTSHLLNSNRVILLGGAQKLKISDLFTEKSLFNFPKDFCPNMDNCGLNLLSSATVIDFSSMKSRKTNLTFGSARHLSELVQGSDKKSAILIAGGYSQIDKDTIIPSDLGRICSVGSDMSVACSGTDSTLSTSRASASGICVSEKDGLCTEYLIVGGNAVDNDKLSEIFVSDGNKLLSLTSTGTTAKSIIGAEMVAVDGNYFLFGGISEIKNKRPDIISMQINVDRVNGSVAFKNIVIGDMVDAHPDFYRVFHKVTRLEDNSVIITGGLNYDLKPAGSALLFKYENGILKHKGMISMKSGRFGHSAVLITSGALKGALLVTGGLTVNQQGEYVFAEGAELYYPPNL